MPSPLPTTWTEKSAPSSTVFLSGPIMFFQRSDNFYEASGGKLDGSVPSKLNSNFYILAGQSAPGSYRLGSRSDNFITTTAS